MERSSVLRWGVIAIALFLFYKFGWPLISGQSDKAQTIAAVEAPILSSPDFALDAIDAPAKPGDPSPPPPPEGEVCKIKGNRFEAELSSRGAAITHFWQTDPNYARSEAHDLSTTNHERWRSLRTVFRGKDADSQVKYDRFPWKLERGEGSEGGKSCKFTFEDQDVRIVKTVAAHPTRPFELTVDTSVTNLASTPKRHQLTVANYAFRKNSEIKGSLGKVSPFQTELSCAAGKDVQRKAKDDFKSGLFTVAGVDRYAAVNSHYFSQALVPQPGGGEGAVSDLPACGLLAEEWGLQPGASKESDDAAAIYQAKLIYPAKELAAQQTATYRDIAFFGPKEREVLSHAAGGAPKLSELLNLGFFAPVANVLVKILDFIHDHVTFGNWGLAIIVMTICLRSLLFPLTYKSIKTTIAMRRLKPEVDTLNAKFADDAQAKNLAMMELWKKHGVNPFGGCLPQLIQMPVWFAMYTTLQTAVEMYHTKFLWFSDLSAPDKFYVLPLLLGFFMIVQQRIVPQQGMDPMQAKMMMYMLPAVFTVMMLFLPAALGVYMLTNSLLGIGQQLAVERIAPRDKGPGEIVVKEKGTPGKKSQSKAAASSSS